MQIPTAFKCPHCGAPVPFQYGQVAAECEYCGNAVAVPMELRPPPPPPPPPMPQQPIYSGVQIIIGSGGVQALPESATAAAAATPPYSERRRSRSCLPVLVVLALLVVLAGSLGVYVASGTFFFENLFAGGLARLEKTYGADTSQADDLGAVVEAVDVALDPSGNLYAVTYNGQVVRFDAEGNALGSWNVDIPNSHPSAIEAGAGGSVYVVASGDLLKYDGATGTQQRVIEVPEIFGMSDVALAPDGSLVSYLGSSPDQLVRFDPSGFEVARYPRPISSVDLDAIIAPWLVRLAVGRDGRIILLNTSRSSSPLFIYNAQGDFITTMADKSGGDSAASGILSSPSAVAVDSKGNIYVADGTEVKVFDKDGKYTGPIRMPFTTAISGLTLDGEDRLYVVSRWGNKVYRFVPNLP